MAVSQRATASGGLVGYPHAKSPPTNAELAGLFPSFIALDNRTGRIEGVDWKIEIQSTVLERKATDARFACINRSATGIITLAFTFISPFLCFLSDRTHAHPYCNQGVAGIN